MYFETIAKVIAERMDIDIADIKPESTFADLKIDSLDAVDMVMNLEDILGIEIDLDQPVATVDDLDKFIQSKAGAK
ncbi:MAG: acyl carrier protein [Oscillospiraceae bacterium]|nr:acyl carrier protein [Oscillospiraceae bacterium]